MCTCIPCFSEKLVGVGLDRASRSGTHPPTLPEGLSHDFCVYLIRLAALFCVCVVILSRVLCLLFGPEVYYIREGREKNGRKREDHPKISTPHVCLLWAVLLWMDAKEAAHTVCGHTHTRFMYLAWCAALCVWKLGSEPESQPPR